MGCISGELDETEFNIFSMKKTDYNIIMMSTFSYLTVLEDHEDRGRTDKKLSST